MQTSTLDVQVSPSHYEFSKYVSWERWSSYWHQLTEVDAVHPRDVLCIGVGDDIVPSILEGKGYEVSRFDLDRRLGADFVGDVAEIRDVVNGRTFDAILCCQVLEHQPFDKFHGTIAQLKSCVRKRLIVSLPYCYAPIFQLALGFRRSVVVNKCVTLSKFWREWSFDGQHYWEVGAKRYSVMRVTRSIQSSDFTLRRFHAREFPYHLFFVMDRL